MKHHSTNRIFFASLICALVASAGCSSVSERGDLSSVQEWQQLAAVDGSAQSRLTPSHWIYDKYPNLPEVTPKSKTVLLDVDGPGVVTLLHVSKYAGGDQSALMLRVWYDGGAEPAIEMPWMDFLGDVEARTAYFSTVYFSHVKDSHNFRLPMPFRKHIRIEVENPTDSKFDGYTDIQWEKLKALPADAGYLCVEYRTGTPTIPEQKVPVCDIQGQGSIVAHWIQLQADDPRTVKSDFICEGNQELYLDGSKEPQMEYLGSEDCYGFSWGMGGGIQSDHYAAIIRMDRWKSGGVFAMLRCRGNDRIRFSSGCRWEINYQNEFFSTAELTRQPKLHSRASFPMPYRSAVYYYTKKP